MRFAGFRSPYIKVDCPDGPRFILRRPDKAFSIVAANWGARIKAILKAFEGAEANVELNVAKRFRAIIDNLRSNYAELQAHYQAAYLQFAGNPCDKKAYDNYMKANQEIRQKEMKLREIEIRTEKVVKSIKPTKKKATRGYGEFAFNLDFLSAVVGDIEKLISELHFSDKKMISEVLRS